MSSSRINCPSGTVLTYQDHPGPFVIRTDTVIEKTLLNCTELIIPPDTTLTLKKCVILGKIIEKGTLDARQTSLEKRSGLFEPTHIPLSLVQKKSLEHKFSKDRSAAIKIPFQEFESANSRHLDIELPMGQKITFTDLDFNCIVVENEFTLSETFLKGRIILLPDAVLKLVKSCVMGAIVQCEGSSIEKESSYVSATIPFKERDQDYLNPLQLEILNSRLAQRV